MLPIRLHLPDFLVAVIPPHKNNLRPVRRNNPTLGAIHNSTRRASEDRHAPQAGWLGRGSRARRQHVAAVWKPAHAVRASNVLSADWMRLPRAHLPEKHARAVR